MPQCGRSHRVRLYRIAIALGCAFLALACGEPELEETPAEAPEASSEVLPAPTEAPAAAETPAPPPPPERAPVPPESAPAPAPPPQPEAVTEPPPVEEPAFSLDELSERIQHTRALGVFTKLALKNDLDDLLGALRRFHERGEGSLSGLRERYEALVLKLMTLLEEPEPDLALALGRAREEIWSRLADPVGFAELTT